MHRRRLIASLALTPGLLSVPNRRAGAASPIRVIASFSILGDLTRLVAGPHAEVRTLVGPDMDVHVYEPRPADLRALLTAKVLVTNGLGLEGWMNRLTGAVQFKGVTVVAAAKITPRTMQAEPGDAAPREPAAASAKAPGVSVITDPHAWQDPRNAQLYLAAIADGLAAGDPPNAAAYQEAAARYTTELQQADSWIAGQFAPIPPAQRRIITTHDAFGYYGARYGIEFLAPEGISTEFEPSARSIATLVAQIRREKIQAVFIENMTSPRMAQMLAKETGAVLGGTVYSDALSESDGPAPTYLRMLRHNTTLFAQAMMPATGRP